MKGKQFLMIAIGLFLLSALGTCAWNCSSQYRARHWGGTMTVELEPGEKLLFVTWKDEELWPLTRPMHEGERPEQYTFRQRKAGLVGLEGKVIIKERARVKSPH